jgi:acyl-CoA thioester hydrolase
MADSEALAGFPVTVELPILWGDEDAFAHVNNVVYLRWCEQGRVAYLRRIGLAFRGVPRGIGPIVASVTCNYRAPLTYPDTVTIGTRVTRIGNSSIKMEQRIVSRASGQIAAGAEAVTVIVDYATGAAVRVPDEIRAKIADVEGRDVSA